MTLGQFSVAVGAPRKWVQNAFAVLEVAPEYTADQARLLSLTRVLEGSFEIPLTRAFELAATTLADPRDRRNWHHETPDGSVELSVGRDRFYTMFSAALSRARVWYSERQRGRPPRRRRRGIAAAEAYGVDVGLLTASLSRSPAERLRRLDDDVAFLRGLKVIEQ